MFHMNTSNQNGVGTVSNGKTAAPGIAKGTSRLIQNCKLTSDTLLCLCFNINQSYLLIHCNSSFFISDNVYQGSMTPEAANRFNEMLMNERNYNQRRCSIEDPPQSDYEAIDTSLFGWWKAKLRKSQIRKV